MLKKNKSKLIFCKTKIVFCILAYINISQIKAQNDSSFYNKEYTYKSYIVPSILVTYGLINWDDNGWPSSKSTRQYRNQNYYGFSTPIDDYLVFAPLVAMYGLDACKVKSKNNVLNQSLIGLKSIGLSLAIVNILKYSTHILRPDGSADNSFASGHTAAAFAFAEILHQEFKHKPIIVIGAYFTATSVATLRILNNKHWLSDVLVGAGLGIAATKFIYATHQHKWKQVNNKFWPVMSANQMGFLYQF